MKYLIRLFQYNEDKVFKEYEFEHLPYMPRINENLTVDDELYIITEIMSSFDQFDDNRFIIDYTIREVCW